MNKKIFVGLLLSLPVIIFFSNVSIALGADLLVGGTGTCSSTYVSFACANAIDKDGATRWALNNEPSGYWQYDLGGGNSEIINYLVIDHDVGNTEFTQAIFRGSNDGSNWTDITSLSFTSSSTEYFSFVNSTSYRYFRLVQDECSFRGDAICGFDDVWGYFVEVPVVENATSSIEQVQTNFNFAVMFFFVAIFFILFMFK